MTRIANFGVLKEPMRILLFMLAQIVMLNVIVPYPPHGRSFKILKGVSQKTRILKENLKGVVNGLQKLYVLQNVC